jgi:hypothetical protein
MIRFLIFAIAMAALCLLLFKLYEAMRRAHIDWGGIAFACGFIGLAFYLRHVTGMG